MSLFAVGGLAGAVMACALVAVLAVCTVEDLRRRVVPNHAVGLGAVVALVCLSLTAPDLISGRLLAAAGAAAFLLAPALVSPGSMGVGDVKLAAMAALYLGQGVAAALLLAFIAGALAGLLLFIRHGCRARKMTIPFAPYIALGTLIATAHPA